MARAKRAGDTARNARRRFVRQGQRYLQQADQAVGAMKSRYKVLAQDSLEKAVSLYGEDFDKSRAEKPIKDLAKSLGVDISTISPTKNKLAGVAASYEALAKSIPDSGSLPLREREARTLLKRSNIKNRFYGGLIDIWEGLPPAERDDAILEYFNAESLMDVIDELTNAGINIYEPGTTDGETSGEVGLKIAAYAAKNL